MSRVLDYNASTKAFIASATQTISFTSSDVPSDRVLRYIFQVNSTGGTAWTLATIDRIRVKANGVAIFDLSFAQLRAYLFRFCRGGYTTPQAAITSSGGVAQNTQRFTIPFFILDAPTKNDADVCQFPMNSNVTIEITMTTAAAVTGTVVCGYEQTDIPAQCYPKLLSGPMSIGASAASGRHNLSEDGIVEGFGINSVGLLRAKLVLAGRQVLHAAGQVANDADAFDANTSSMLWESQQLDCPWSTSSAGTAYADTVPNDPIFVDVHAGLNAPPGASYLELQTGASWGGIANEVCVYSVVPYGRAA